MAWPQGTAPLLAPNKIELARTRHLDLKHLHGWQSAWGSEVLKISAVTRSGLTACFGPPSGAVWGSRNQFVVRPALGASGFEGRNKL